MEPIWQKEIVCSTVFALCNKKCFLWVLLTFCVRPDLPHCCACSHHIIVFLEIRVNVHEVVQQFISKHHISNFSSCTQIWYSQQYLVVFIAWRRPTKKSTSKTSLYPFKLHGGADFSRVSYNRKILQWRSYVQQK